jgi:Na+-driven multidrug efflux pump
MEDCFDMDASLTRGPIRTHLLRMAIPMSIGMFFNTMFNVTDTFFAGKLGTEALAGMSVSFSVFFILTAFVSGIGTGVAALLSNALGREDNAQVDQFTVNGLFLTLAVSSLLSVVGFLFSRFTGSTRCGRRSSDRRDPICAHHLCRYALFRLNSTLTLSSARELDQAVPQFSDYWIFDEPCTGSAVSFWLVRAARLGTRGVALATVIVQMAGNVYLGYKVRRLLN